MSDLYEQHRKDACGWCEAGFTLVDGAHYCDVWTNKSHRCTALSESAWAEQAIAELLAGLKLTVDGPAMNAPLDVYALTSALIAKYRGTDKPEGTAALEEK